MTTVGTIGNNIVVSIYILVKGFNLDRSINTPHFTEDKFLSSDITLRCTSLSKRTHSRVERKNSEKHSIYICVYLSLFITPPFVTLRARLKNVTLSRTAKLLGTRTRVRVRVREFARVAVRYVRTIVRAYVCVYT